MLTAVNDSLGIAHIFESLDHVFVEYSGYKNQPQRLKGTIHSIDSLAIYIRPNVFRKDSVFAVSIDDITGIRRVRLSLELLKSLSVLASSLTSLYYLNTIETSQVVAILGSASVAFLVKQGGDSLFPSSKAKLKTIDGWRFKYLKI